MGVHEVSVWANARHQSVVFLVVVLVRKETLSVQSLLSMCHVSITSQFICDLLLVVKSILILKHTVFAHVFLVCGTFIVLMSQIVNLLAFSKIILSLQLLLSFFLFDLLLKLLQSVILHVLSLEICLLVSPVFHLPLGDTGPRFFVELVQSLVNLGLDHILVEPFVLCVLLLSKLSISILKPSVARLFLFVSKFNLL